MATNNNNNAPDTTAAPTVEVAQSKKDQDVTTILSMVEVVNGIAVDTKHILDNYHYPPNNLVDLVEAAGEFTRALTLAASYIINPSAPDIVDAVKERIESGID